MVKPSGPRALSPLKLDKAARTSSSKKEVSNASDSTLDKESNYNPLMLGLHSLSFARILLKSFTTPSLMLSSSVNSSLSILNLSKKKFLLLALAILWKNFVFLSPSFSHNSLDFYLQEISSKSTHFLKSSTTILHYVLQIKKLKSSK